MKIPILDLKKQYKGIRLEVDRALRKVMAEQDFVLGKELDTLEKEIASYCHTRYAAGVASGTDALILALRALGVKEGDEVITTPFTFFATAEAVSIVGARPVFVDIDPKTYNMDPGLIEDKISDSTKAVIVVHLYGQCADMDPIIAIVKRHNLKIIEDCAQAVGAAYKTKRAGSMGDAGALSFFPSKNLGAFGDGGMVVANDLALAERVRLLRAHGSPGRYIHTMIGTNSRLDSMQAAVLRVKLKYLDGWLKTRRENAEYYNKNLSSLPLEIPYVPDANVHTYHLYTLRVREGSSELIRFLASAGIEARTYYPVPLHLQECYASLGYKRGDLPEAEKAAQETLSIPVYPEMTLKEKDFVIAAIKDFF